MRQGKGTRNPPTPRISKSCLLSRRRPRFLAPERSGIDRVELRRGPFRGTSWVWTYVMKDRLKLICDVFSRRNVQRPPGYKPDLISETLRNRIFLVYRDVFSGKWTDGAYYSPGDHNAEFWEEMHNSLEHLYGRAKLSVAAAQSRAEDAIRFLEKCQPAEFFDFLELTFRVDAIWRVL